VLLIDNRFAVLESRRCSALPRESKAAATNDWYSLRALQHRGLAINQAVPPFQQNPSSTQTNF
jgi:hypothetical protein